MDLDRRVVFFNPDGHAIAGAPPIGLDAAHTHQHHPDRSAEPPRHRNRARGIQPDPLSTHPPYARDSLVPWHIEAAAWEAVDQP